MILRLFLLIFLFSCNGHETGPSPHEELAAVLSETYQSGSYMPLVSNLKPGIEIDGAYKVQKYFVGSILKNDKIAGYKTGLASKKAQQKFHVDDPISAVLFQSGEMSGSPEIKISDYITMLVETELGYRVGREITSPVKNINELDSIISSILPVIELPDVRFDEHNNSKLTDVVAANICSSKFITGTEHEFNEAGTGDLSITLKLNGKVINRVNTAGFMDYQKELLMWLINNRLENGWEIKPGQLLITGAMKKINTGKPGMYEADYGPLGKINFEVRK